MGEDQRARPFLNKMMFFEIGFGKAPNASFVVARDR